VYSVTSPFQILAEVVVPHPSAVVPSQGSPTVCIRVCWKTPIPPFTNIPTGGSRDRASGGAGDVLRWRSERELPETCIDRIDEFGRRAVGRESDGVHGDFLQTPIPASANPEPADGYT
jgi:hypothetical protein